jgi:uncharacterized protein
VDVERADVELRCADGVTLASTTWRGRNTDPGAAVVLVHGLGIDRNDRSITATASALVDTGWAVVAPDTRGHGASDGVCTLGTDEALDVAAAVAHAKTLGVCVVAVGSSMGGVAVLRYAQTASDLAGCVIVSAPATWRVHSARSLAAAAITRTAIGRRAIHRRAGVRLSAKWGAPAAPRDVAAGVTCPAAIVHGANDRFIPPREATRLFERLGGPRRLDIVDGMHHGFGPAAQEAIVDAVCWVLATTATVPVATTMPVPPGPGRCGRSSPR